jgi:hypothetical protein
MGMTGFSDAEMALLSGLDAVAWVTRTRITYKDSFKREAIERYRRGESPVRIFREAGLDPRLIGNKRIERCIARWKREPPDAGTTRPHAPAAAPARDVERRPLKEPGSVEKETDENHRNKGPGRVPDDMPYRLDVTEMHNTDEKRENCAERRAPAPRLPDNESECEDKDRESRKHGGPRLQAASDRLKDLSEGKR